MPEMNIEAGARLPLRLLRGTADGEPLHIEFTGRFCSIVLIGHESCAACARQHAELEALRDELACWDCRVFAAVPAAAEITPVPALVFADPWGEVAVVQPGGSEHAFPAPAEVLEWARHLATRCPECEGEAL